MAFQPGLWYSTTSIFLNNASPYLYNLRLRSGIPWQIRILDNVYTPPAPPTIFSSSQGLVAVRSNLGRTYHVGNPYLINSPYARLPDPPSSHSPNNTHAALAIDPSSPVFLLICVRRVNNSLDYIVHVFNSFDYAWCSHTQTVTNVPQNVNLVLVPNTGVGLGKAAFWILRHSAQAPSAVLWCTITDVDRLPEVSILALPPRLAGQARMQLGRAMGRLGLVIVTNSAVELFTLHEYLVTSGRPWLRQESFRIEILQQQQDHADGDQEADSSMASWRQEDMTLVCREMPRPMRFDSFNADLLFWVRGQVVMLQSTGYGTHQYRLLVLPNQGLPASIIDGVPHVWSGRSIASFDHRRTP